MLYVAFQYCNNYNLYYVFSGPGLRIATLTKRIVGPARIVYQGRIHTVNPSA
jgi:hypothetical protein